MDVALRPFYRCRSLLSPSEQRFYSVLKRLARGYTVFAKVRLADLVEADWRHLRRKSNFDYIKAKHIDFVICNEAFSPLVAVELDDSSHGRPDRIARDRAVNRIFEIADFPLVRIPVRREFDEAEIAQQLLSKLAPKNLS